MAAVAAGISLVAACTSQEASNPGSALTTLLTTTTAVTTTTAATVSTTSTVAPTTSTTEASPTTTVALAPIDASIPLITGGGAEAGWLFLGTWQAGSWLDPTRDDGSPIDPAIAEGSSFAISGLSVDTGTGTIGANTQACPDGRVGPIVDPAAPGAEPPGAGFSVIALPASWPLQPRPVAQLTGGVTAYQSIGESAFDDLQVSATQGRVRQIVITDLDGDGDDEALVVFESGQDTASAGSPGDFATLLLVETATRKATRVAVSAIGTDVDPGSATPLMRYRVLDVADLNSDGRLEVIVNAWTTGETSVIVYDYDGAALTQVLSTTCPA